MVQFMPYNFPFVDIDDHFGDVGGQVGHALKVAGRAQGVQQVAGVFGRALDGCDYQSRPHTSYASFTSPFTNASRLFFSMKRALDAMREIL